MRTTALVTANVALLMQGRGVLACVSDRAFAEPAPATNGIRIGAHLRHVLEFYECFLHGVDAGAVDYGRRRRNGAVETSRAAALERIEELVARLERMPGLRIDLPMRVRSEETGTMLSSTIGRELEALLSHTIHHFAMIAVALHALDTATPPEFGVAPSTLRYRMEAA